MPPQANASLIEQVRKATEQVNQLGASVSKKTGNSFNPLSFPSSFSASDLNSKTAESTLRMPRSSPNTSSSNSIFDLTAGITGLQEQLNADFQESEKRLNDVQKEKESRTKKSQGFFNDLQNLFKTRPDSAELLESNLDKYGVDEDLGAVRSLIGEIGGLRTQLNTLNMREALALESETGRGEGIPQVLINGKQAKIQREYAIRKSAVSAELGAKAAVVEALRGNITQATQLASAAVEAAVFDYQQKVDDYRDLFTYNQDIIDSLSDEEKTLLSNRRDILESELAQKRADATTVAQLMVDNPTAGISVYDSILEAASKVSQSGGSLEARRESRLLSDTGGSGSDSIFTKTQLNTGASRAGYSVEEFGGFSDDIKNFYINLTNDEAQATTDLFNQVQSGEVNPEDVNAQIDSLAVPQVVKDHLKARVAAAAAGVNEGGEQGKGFIARTWDAIKGLFNLGTSIGQ